MTVLCLLFAFAFTCEMCRAVSDDVDSAQTSSLRQRVDQLERILAEQNSLYGQGEKVSRLERLLQSYEAQLSENNDLIKQQRMKLSQHDDLIQQQAAKLSHQENSMRQLQESVRALQDNQALYVTEEIAQLRHEQPSVKVSSEGTTSRQQGEHDVMSGTSHDVMARSDDGGPLEAVVSNIGRQVTEMGADIQVLKAKTATDIQTLKNSNLQQDSKIAAALTSIFVQWGSSACSNSSQLVYSGVIGGSFNTHPGAATNYLCMTMSPVLSSQSLPAYYTYLYGAEYQTYDSHAEMDPLCAVCQPSYPQTIMIPGTNVCTPCWHRQYSGFLMAGWYNHAAGSEFICVDSRMESRPGSNADMDSKLLYYTVTRCGSLPCEPYVTNKIVSCVVCSK